MTQPDGHQPPVKQPAVTLSGRTFSLFEVEQVARRGLRVEIGGGAMEKIAASEAALKALMASRGAIYGVNTGFGSFSRTRIDADKLTEVQHNLIRSHAAGVGEPLAEDVVRAMLLLLAGSLSRGCSGVRAAVVETVVGMLNGGVTPVVPSVGSVGASGDLAPLAHCALVMIGEGEAKLRGERMHGGEAMRRAGVRPLSLGPKEGLALINGTHLMAAQGALAMVDAERLIDAALCACAMSIDACRGTDSFLDERVYAARNQAGPRRAAVRLKQLLAGSEIIPSHAENDPRVQDPYSLRCAPVVLGAVLDGFDHVRAIVEDELGAVTDNPLVFAGEGIEATPPGGHRGIEGGKSEADVVSAGNFHGMPIAIPMDHLAILMCHVAGISERRVFHLLSASDPEMHLRPHLAPMPGLNSGLMIAQYTAAACVNEIATLCMPASVVNIPTSAGMEDYNSFGPRSCAKARRAVELATSVVAIELLCSAEAMEYHRPLKSGAGVEQALGVVREVVPRLTGDRPPAPDIEAVSRCIGEGRFL
ncbi:MAG: histidine ammonia-lyase [Phycisphaerales bacterium]